MEMLVTIYCAMINAAWFAFAYFICAGENKLRENITNIFKAFPFITLAAIFWPFLIFIILATFWILETYEEKD